MPDIFADESRRRAGVLLHPAALGPQALGEPAWRFIDWLSDAGFACWQMLPLGPVGADRSPYWVQSDFAGNPDLLPAARRAPTVADCNRFLDAEQAWLSDFALHRAISIQHGASWPAWPVPLRDRQAAALHRARGLLDLEISAVVREQCAFAQHWRLLRDHAARRGIALIGDLPMYVAPDSVETWVHREEFVLQPDGRPALLAGVPPDYFSAAGQLWGNPLYDWRHAAANGFAHFRRRVAAALQRVDCLRIDHFRALAAHWALPPDARDARRGAWRPTPGADLLAALRTDWPTLPFIAEDLGDITPDVRALRERFALPGMAVMQFGFDGDPANPHRPENFRARSVAYLGTHDNDTTLGWVLGLDSETLRRACAEYMVKPAYLPRRLREALLASRVQLAVLTIPDVLGLGSEARYNTPGQPTGNWSWQVPAGALTQDLAARIRVELAAADRVESRSVS